MNPEEIRELLHRDPLEPFRITLSSGESFDIRDANSVALGKSRMFIAFSDSERWAFCPYLHVTSLQSLANGGHAPPRKPGGSP